MRTVNIYAELHYQNFVIRPHIAAVKYWTILHDTKRFRLWLDQSYMEMPSIFPEGFSNGYRFKDNRMSRLYGVQLRSIQIVDGKIFTILPSFVEVASNLLKPSIRYTPEDIVRFILRSETKKISLRENEIRAKYRSLYLSATVLFGSWKIALESAGFSQRKANSLCKDQNKKTSGQLCLINVEEGINNGK